MSNRSTKELSNFKALGFGTAYSHHYNTNATSAPTADETRNAHSKSYIQSYYFDVTSIILYIALTQTPMEDFMKTLSSLSLVMLMPLTSFAATTTSADPQPLFECENQEQTVQVVVYPEVTYGGWENPEILMTSNPVKIFRAGKDVATFDGADRVSNGVTSLTLLLGGDMAMGDLKINGAKSKIRVYIDGENLETQLTCTESK